MSPMRREELSTVLSLNKRPCIGEMHHSSTPEAENSLIYLPPMNQTIPCSLHFCGCSSITINVMYVS